MQEEKTTESLLRKYVLKASAKSQSSFNHIFSYMDVTVERYQLIALLAYLCREQLAVQEDGFLAGYFSKYTFFEDILSEYEISQLKSDLVSVAEIAFTSPWMLDHASEFSTPEEIVKLMLDISGLQEGSSIYNPFAGMNSVAVVGKRYHVFGEELNQHAWALGQLRLLLTGRDATIIHGNSFHIEPYKKIDNVICCPPFAQKEFVSVLRDWYKSLKDGGQIVMLVEPGMLCSQANRQFWGEMVDKKAVRMVAQLPENLLRHTEIAPCLVVLEKKEKNSILFADFSFAHHSYSAKSKLQVLDLAAIEHTLETVAFSIEKQDDILKVVPYSAYREFLGVNPLFYMVDRPEGTLLQDVATIIRNYEKVPEDKPFQIVQPATLSATYPLAPIAPHVEEKAYRTTRYVRIPDNSVLVTANNKGLLIGYTEKLGEMPVYAPHTIQVLCPKDISCAHLMLLLKQPVVEKQFLYANKGTRGIILNINREILGNMVLPLIPSEAIEEHIDKAKLEAMSEGERKLLDEFNLYKKRVSLNKHAASQNISSLDSVLKSLKVCLEQNGWNAEGTKRLNAVSDFTVKSAVEFLVEQIGIVSNQIRSLMQPEKKAEKLADIDPQNFTDDYFAANPPLRFVVRNEMDNHYKERLKLAIPDEETGKFEIDYIEEGTPIHYIHFPMEALRQIYQNIISNAVTYGFTDPLREDYCIVFNMRMDGSSVIVEISNNGTPLGDDVNPMDILLDGFSSKLNEDGHEGHGGAEVAELMKKYKGTAEVFSDPKDEFSLTYRLTFTDTNVINLKNIC